MIEKNKIYCGDNLELIKQLDDNCIDLTVTSPPYNINLRLHGDKYTKRSKCETGPCNKYNMFSDDLDINEYYLRQKKTIKELLRVSKYTFYIIQLVTGNKEALLKLFGDFNKEIKEIIIWDKQTAEPSISDGVINSQYEFIIVFSKNAKQRQFKDANFKRGTFSNVMRCNKSRGGFAGHAAVFPEELVSKIILNFSKKGDLILDPFMGSGTTAKMALKNQRNFIGFELSQEYVDLANQRIMPWKEQTRLF